MNEKEEIEEVEYKIEDAELNSESKEFMIKSIRRRCGLGFSICFR